MIEHCMKVLLDDGFVVAELNLLLESAERAFELLLSDVKLQVRAAAFTRKRSPLALVDRLPRLRG
jgi:hypothetical protein